MADATAGRKPFYKLLYAQVLIAILLGFLFGWLAPDFAQSEWVKALGDGFVKLIKMVIAPIIFCTVASGIAHIDDARKVGRVGVKALVYFEIVSTLRSPSASSSATSPARVRGSAARPTPAPSPTTRPAPRTRARWSSSSTSSPTAWSALSRAATFCRSCSSP
jgi:hypothetical protein